MKKLKEASLFFVIQCILYCLLVVNYRSVVEMNYAMLVITDFVIASFSFFVVRKISQSAESIHQWLGYALGGAVGGMLGLWIDSVLK